MFKQIAALVALGPVTGFFLYRLLRAVKRGEYAVALAWGTGYAASYVAMIWLAKEIITQ